MYNNIEVGFQKVSGRSIGPMQGMSSYELMCNKSIEDSDIYL